MFQFELEWISFRMNFYCMLAVWVYLILSVLETTGYHRHCRETSTVLVKYLYFPKPHHAELFQRQPLTCSLWVPCLWRETVLLHTFPFTASPMHTVHREARPVTSYYGAWFAPQVLSCFNCLPRTWLQVPESPQFGVKAGSTITFMLHIAIH